MTCAPDLRPLSVCLDARLRDGQWGGVQQFVLGLAAGLSSLRDGAGSYRFLVIEGQDAWIRPYLTGPCQAVSTRGEQPPAHGRVVDAVARWFYRTPVAALRPVHIPASDGFIEANGIDVMHFTLQSGFRTSIPSLYQPYDLQHLHFPQFFTAYERKQRERMYRAMCAQASAVVVMSSWVSSDVAAQYGVPQEKLHVIPWAPVVRSYDAPTADDLARTRDRFRLPAAFAFYPAQTWAHKNHLRLLDAVAALRDRDGVEVPVVCSGTRTDFFPRIRRRSEQLRLGDLVRFVGFVSPVELRCLYQLARLVVFPSLFEGGGMPVFEAFALGVPVACSNATCLPKQAAGAALLFDPTRTDDIAQAVLRVWSDAGVRDDLIRRGRARVAQFTWEATARRYRALYRSIARRPLTEEDEVLLREVPAT